MVANHVMWVSLEKHDNVASGDTTEAMLTIRCTVPEKKMVEVNNVVIYKGPIVV